MTFFLPFNPAQAHPAATSLANGAASLAAPPAGGRGEFSADTPLPPAGGAGGGLQEIPASAGMTTEEQYAPGHTPVFSPQAQGAFLDNLSINGNVRHACKVARVSPQTAYRARRKSPALATLWDAALLSARTRAEEVLATRALDGVEESVFYHGEEVATRTRFDSRLLLAHLGRLDRLAEREEVTAHLAQLDDLVDALKRGEGLDEIVPLDPVPSVPSCRTPRKLSDEERLSAMDAARPEDALTPYQLASSVEETGEIEALQLEAFEAGLPEWWLITCEEALETGLTHALKQRSDRADDTPLAADAGEGVSCAGQEESCDETDDDGKRSFGAGTGGERAAERGDLCEDPRHRR